jgi:fibronectin-binding autotransporter adhesin
MSQSSAMIRIIRMVIGFALLSPSVLMAASGTWIEVVPGTYSWDDTTRWSGGTIADGATTTANFNTVNPAGDITVNLDVNAHTVGSITFGDTDTSSAAGWTIASPIGIGLSLDNSGSPATITVNNLGAGKVATISAPVFSFAGLVKAGPGTLALTNASLSPNSFNGGITISGGTLQVTTASLGATDVLNNANLTFDQAVAPAGAYSNVISGSGTLTKSGAATVTLGVDQTYTGATILNAGGLTVSGNLASQSLVLGGGTLTLSSTGPTPVNFSLGTTLNGPSTVTATAVVGTAALGPITRNSGGAVNFNLPTTAPGAITTTSTNTNGILGGWATVGGTDYAMSNAGTIAAYSGYTNDSWAAGNNTKITQATSSQSGATTNTLRIGGDFATDHTFTAAAAGNTIVVDSATGLQVGAVVTGTGIPADTRITAINGTNVTLSRNVPITAAPVTLNYGASGPTATVNLSGTNSIAAGGILTNIYSPATTFNGGSLTGAAGGGDVIFHQFATASGNMTVNSTIVNNGGTTGVVKSGTGTVLLGSDNSYTGNILVGGGNLTLAGNNSSSANTTIGSGATLQVGNGGSSGAINMAGTISNSGTLTFNRSGSLAITKKINGTGGVTFSGGLAATLDFTAAGAPTADLLSTGGYTMTGGAGLTVSGKANTTNVQNFTASTFGNGLSTITVNNGSGTGTATVNLGTLSAQIGSAARFLGPTTQDATGSPVPATGFLNTSVAGTGGGNALGTNNIQGLAGQGWATVGLYDFAATLPDPIQAGVFNIVGGSQVPAFYTTTYPNVTGSNVNFDMIANTTIPSGGAQKATGTIRFNNPTATALTSGNSNLITNQAILITPNMGANNANFNLSSGGSGSWQVVRSTTAGAQEGLVWQNNVNGFFNVGIQITDGRSNTTNPTDIVKAGLGTMVVSNSTNNYTGGLRLLEGATLVPNTGGNGALGVGTISVATSSTGSPNVTLAAAAPATLTVGAGFLGQTIAAINGTAVTLSGNANQTIAAATNASFLTPLFLNGGTMVGSGGSYALNTGGATATGRPVALQANGGALAATTGNRLTVTGLVSNGVNAAGALTIGTGAIAGTGAGTANTTALFGDGEVLLSGSNTYTGGTVVNNGTLLIGNTSGSATGTGGIAVNNGGHIGGNGTASGMVILNSGGHVSAGTAGTNSSIGTLTVGGASFLGGSILDVDLSPASNDLLMSTNGLSIASGTGVNLFQAGTNGQFGINGVYNIFNVTSGSIPSLGQLQSNLSVLNPAAGGNYTWGLNGNFVTLTIAGLANASTWTFNGGGSWATSSNWNPSVPGNAGDSATFGSATTSGTAHIAMNGNRTVGTLSFNNSAASYSIEPGSGGVLTLNNNTSSAAVNDASGSHTIAADVVLASDTSITVTNAADALTISGAISGAKNLSVAGGAGSLILSGANSYGNTTIGAGSVIQVGAGGPSGSLGTGVVTDNGTLTVNRSNAYSLDNAISGSGALVHAGTGTTTLTNAGNAGTWSTTVNNGTLSVGTGSALGSGSLTMGGGILDLNGYSPTFTSLAGTGGTINNLSGGGTTVITLNQAGNSTFSGTIANASGVVSLVKSGAAALTLAGTGTYDGNTTITNGSITLASNNAVKAGTTIDVQATSGLFFGNVSTGANILLTLPQNTATQMFDVVAGSNATISGNITEGAATGGAQTRFNAGNNPTTTSLTFTGNVTTSTGITDLERGSFIFAGNSVFTATGSSGIWFGRNAGSNVAVVVKDNAQLATTSLSLAAGGAATNSVNFTIQDNAIASAGTGTFELNGAASNATGDATTVRFNGGTVQTGGFLKTAATQTTLTLNGTVIRAGLNATTNPNFLPAAAGLIVNVQAGGAKFDTNSVDILIPAALLHDPALDTVTPTPDGGLTKSGAGRLTLSNFNTYNGPTTISGGTLTLQGSGLIGSTSKVVLNGGVLDTSGIAQTFTVPLQLTSNSAIDVGAFGSGQLIFADSHLTAWTSGTTLSVINWTGTPGIGGGTDQLLFGAGGLTTGANSQVSQIHFQGYNGATLLGSGEVVPASISTRKLGDWDTNGTLNASDIPAMLQALVNLNAYKTSHSLTNEDFLNIADVNGSGTVTNADMQATLDLLANLGFGSLASVPEPSTFVLLGMGAAFLLVRRRQRAVKLG